MTARRAALAAVRVAAQAKINLFLRILAREASGYHQLETLFCRIDLADSVVVRLTSTGGSIDCRGTDVGPVAHNLAYKATLAYAAVRRTWPPGFAIEIDKHIPVGAGLGGGSADAGAVLRALHALDPEPLPDSILLDIARQLGADVPFLSIDAALALGWGRGDRLLPIPALPRRQLLLHVPRLTVSTREAYEWLATARGDVVAGAVVLPEAALREWPALVPYMVNDFEPVVAGQHSVVAGALATLRAAPGVCAASLTGSGSAVYAVIDEATRDATDAMRREAASRLRAIDAAGARVLHTATADHVVAVEPLE
jgi:4-diphosphocytidyl-2-C-methyl-D-erythritol kinase